MLFFDTFVNVFLSIVLPSAIVISIAFLPSFIELKRRLDAGPKIISFSKLGALGLHFILLDLEAGESSQFSVNRISFPALIGDLEF
jgi:hypothetical protein